MKNPNLSTMNLAIELVAKIAKAQFTKSTARTEQKLNSHKRIVVLGTDFIRSLYEK